MPRENKGLEAQLEGLFDIPDVQADQKPLDVEVVERTIVGLLENEVEGPGRILAEPIAAGPIAAEPGDMGEDGREDLLDDVGRVFALKTRLPTPPVH